MPTTLLLLLYATVAQLFARFTELARMNTLGCAQQTRARCQAEEPLQCTAARETFSGLA